MTMLRGGANMTREQYETFENFQFLTDEEKDHEKELNCKNEYGLTYNQMLTLTRKHKAARKASDYRTMTRIEYRLTDINFHSLCGQLYKGEYADVYSEVKKMQRSSTS